MQRNKSTPSSALEKASMFLNRNRNSSISTKPKVSKSVQDTETSDDDADLNQYLSTITKKTTNVPHDGLSDISISSEDGKPIVKEQKPAKVNKFLKSSSSVVKAKSDELEKKHLQQSNPKLHKSFTSPALGESSALRQSEKFLKRSFSNPRKMSSVFSDESGISDLSESSVKGDRLKFLKSSKQKKDPKSITDSKTSKTSGLEADSDHFVGHQPNRFLKTKPEKDLEVKKSPNHKKLAIDEDLQGLSPVPAVISDSEDQSKAQNKKAHDKNEDSSFATESFPTRSDQSESSIHTDSEGPIKMRVMDINALMSMSSPTPTKSQPLTKQKTPGKADKTGVLSSMGLMTVDDLMQSTTISSSQFEKPIETDSESSIKTHVSNESIHTQENYETQSSIKTESHQSLTAEEINTQSPTKSDDYSSDFSDDDTMKDTESIKTEGSRSDDHYNKEANGSYSEDFDSTYTSSFRSKGSRSSRSRSKSSRGKSRSFSESSFSSSTVQSDSRKSSYTYTRSQSQSPSPSLSTQRSSKSYSSAEDTSKYSSDAYSSRFEETSKQCVDVQVQTGLDLEDMILKYHWMTGAMPSSNKATVGETSSESLPGATLKDPTSLAGFAVSAEALDALTSYNPAILAAHDMLKQQVKLCQQFLAMQTNIHKNIMSSIEKEHHYTTLEETKQYIERHRKQRLTFEEAVKLVKEEMNA